MSRTVLLIDDDPSILAALGYYLETRGWGVSRAADGRTGLELYEAERYDLVVCDLEMPGLNGLQVIEILRTRDPEALVMMLTGHGDIAVAVQALQLGAENFLTKPVDFDHLEAATERAFEKAELRKRNRFLQDRQLENPQLAALERWPSTRELARQVALLAGGRAPVFLGGETGTGKGWVARLLHSVSPRAAAPFVEVNCAGLSATFLDSELFGHEKGAFTDAKAAKRGLFEVADGGTLFLDEIGDLAPELQPKLLKALESQRFRRLGGTRELQVDVRLVAATHKDLEAEVRAGRFREDLFYRLAVLPLRLPPLRERGRGEIADLARSVVAELHARSGTGPAAPTPESLELLVRYPWPGNIRELRNVLERAHLLAGGADQLAPEHLSADFHRRPGATPDPIDDELTLVAAERRQIARVLERFGHNRAQSARALGITRATLYKKMRLHGLEQPLAGAGRGR